jgi:hypothetical protein
MGDETAIPTIMPGRPQEPGEQASKYARSQYKIKSALYLACTQWRNAGITVLETIFPSCLNLKKGKFGLPASCTLKEAFEHVQDNANTLISKREAYIELEEELTEKAKIYEHVPKSSSCADYLDAIKEAKDYLDSLGVRAYPTEHLIMRCQQAIRNGVGERKDLIRIIDHDWEDKLTELSLDKGDVVWRTFKEFYVEALDRLDEDGLLDGRRGRAKIAGLGLDEARMRAFEARLEDVSSDLYKVDNALSVVAERFPVPSVVHASATDPSVGKSALESQAESHRIYLSFMDEKRKAEKANEEIRKLRKQLETTTVATASTTQYTPNTIDVPNVHRDRVGDTWKQMIFYCSSHGCNPSHSNEQCNNRKSYHAHGATFQDRKGGSPEHVDKRNWWCKNRAKGKSRVIQQHKPE